MKIKITLTSMLASAALLSGAFAADQGRNAPVAREQCPNGGPENCPDYRNGTCPGPQQDGAQCRGGNNPNCAPKRDGTGGPQQNPNRQPKRDGTGGPGKPANPAGPQDGSGPGPRR